MSDNKKPPVLEVVKSSKPPKANDKKPPAKAGGIDDVEFGAYRVIKGAFWQRKAAKDGDVVEFPLCNFVCRIIEEVTADDGLNDSAYLRIEGRRADGVALPSIDVPTKSFYSTQGNWPNEFWGTLPFIYPGAAKKDNLRAAIHQYSGLNHEIPRRKIYRYTGWKKIDDAWHFLHGAGAITSNGLVGGIEVDLGQDHMKRYQLTAPLSDDELRQAVADALLLLDLTPKRPYIGAVLLAAVARAPLGECMPTDFIIWLHGRTGSRKSAICAIAQAFFGDFTAHSFPANWVDTVTIADNKAYKAKDCLMVVDDFKPSVNRVESEKLHAMAERFIRGTGNQAGRGRYENNLDKAGKYNRSMSIVTAEDLPRGVSLLARMLVLELGRGDVDLEVLTKLQDVVETGRFTGLMSAYLQWLAPRLDQIKRELPVDIKNLRKAASDAGFAESHGRAPQIYANLLMGIEMFLEFLESVGALDRDQSGVLLGEFEENLKQPFRDQGDYLIEQDEVERFLNLLRAVLSSGNGHIANRLDQRQPKTRPYAWGWRDTGTDLTGDKQYKPMGDCLGWYAEGTANSVDEVWIQPDTCFKAIQQFSSSQGNSFLLSSSGLWRQLLERGLLLKSEPQKGRSKPTTTVKRTVSGRSVRVLVMSAELIESG